MARHPQDITAFDTLAVELVGYMNAFNREGMNALTRIPSLYAEDLSFQDPLTTTKGLDASMGVNRRMMARARAIHMELGDVLRAGDQLFLSWKMKYVPKLGPAIIVDGCSHCRVRDGKIAFQRDDGDVLSSFMDTLPIVGTRYHKLTRAFASPCERELTYDILA